MALTLAELGEFAVLQRLLPVDSPESGIGDDCFLFPFGEGFLAVTADPGPAPLTRLLGPEWHDMSVWGWYAVVANASDLATVGAAPMFMTNCVFAPPNMSISDLESYFAGFNAALREFGFFNAGGDLSSGATFRSACTAVGSLPTNERLGRSGCSPGDVLACVGSCGTFAAAFLHALRASKSDLTPKVLAALTRPTARLRDIRSLRAAVPITAASDASDGLLGGIWNIAERSNCSFRLDLTDEMLSAAVQVEAKYYGIDAWNLFSFWGDWQVVVTFPLTALEKVVQLANDSRLPLLLLGRAQEGPPELRVDINEAEHSVDLFRNEHFSSTSYLFARDEEVVRMMRRSVFKPT